MSVTVFVWEVEHGLDYRLTLAAGEAMRMALLGRYRELGHAQFPDAFHRSAAPARHAHAHYLPLPDEDGMVGSVTLVAPAGLDRDLVKAAAAVSEISVGGRSYAAHPAAMGDASATPLCAAARTWTSVSPFVTPLGRLRSTGKARAKYTPGAQILSELSQRTLPLAEVRWGQVGAPGASDSEAGAHGWVADRLVAVGEFAATRERRPGKGPLPDAVAAFATLAFDEPVAGPLSLGYGAHFGLGLFVPVV